MLRLTIGDVRGTARRIVGIAAGVARTSAVVVLRAMRACYHHEMAISTDLELRETAESTLAEAQVLLGLPAVVVGYDVSGDDFWSTFADRAKGLLKKASTAPLVLGSKAGAKIRDATRTGLQKASEASAEARTKLGAVATAAGVLALGPGILLGLALFAVVEGSGLGGRARATGRRYLRERARAYGF